MDVSLNMTFGDGSVVALWKITESEGKSLSEQRLAVDALIDSVFKGKYRLCHDGDGIPALEGNTPSVPFVSVSHTKGWVAVMTNPEEHVGIDIELADRNFSAVEKKSLSATELSQIDRWAEDLKNRNTVLGLLWCAKEAVYKRLTVPATDFANQIEIENIVPTSTATTKEEPALHCEPRAEGEITAIFKHGDGVATKIRLEYYIISGLLLVYTID